MILNTKCHLPQMCSHGGYHGTLKFLIWNVCAIPWKAAYGFKVSYVCALNETRKEWANLKKMNFERGSETI
jgi:hypothetical protein